MKILLVFAVVVATTYAYSLYGYTQEMLSKEYTEKIKQEQRKCKIEFPSITDFEFEQLTNGRKKPSTRDEECFMKCFAQERGYYKGPGQIDFATLTAVNAQKYKNANNIDGANKIDQSCAEKMKTETDECRTVTRFYECRVIQAKSLGFTFPKYYTE